MEVEIYKMIYIAKINKQMEKEIKDYKREVQEEMKSNNLRILGYAFVKNNRNKAKLIINNKKYNIKEYINIKETKDDNLKIKMALNNDLSNLSNIYKNCYKLKEVYFNATEAIFDFYDFNFDYIVNDKDHNKNENSKVTFYKYLKDDYSLTEITGIKKDENKNNSSINYIKDYLKTKKLKCYSDMSQMFMNCISLLLISGISNVNTNNVKYMDKMFSFCSSLSSLPDISKWNTNNINDMSEMFYNCSSLTLLIIL